MGLLTEIWVVCYNGGMGLILWCILLVMSPPLAILVAIVWVILLVLTADTRLK